MIELLKVLAALADPIAHMVGLALQDYHDENDEKQLMFKTQRAISDLRAKRKFGDPAAGSSSGSPSAP